MDKLIDLLNEYNGKEERFYDTEERITCRAQNYIIAQIILISKSYGFIKWLVDNDKIDRHSEKLELDMKRMRIPQDYYIGGLQSLDLQHKKAQYLSLIALLSIQDNPIEFLCEILKENKSEFEELIDRNIDVAKRLASK